MINPLTTAKIFSTLGNNSSLIPLGIKDISNIAGMTTGSYITGSSVEGRDRFIDEVGASVIWLLGIPFFKKIIDKTVYKAAGYNPHIDTRVLQNEKILKKAIEQAPTKQIKESLEHVAKNQKIFKNLALAKFIVSTALTLGSYSILTIFRHKHTEKTIIAELKKEEELKKVKEEIKNNSISPTFKAFNKKQAKNPSFGMNMNVLKQFMFDPVRNTMIIDGGITTERLAESRNPQDFMGYVIKEGGFLAFIYFLGPAIQKYLEQKAAKSHKPIDLDIRVLQDTKLQNAIKNKSIQKDLNDLSSAFTQYQNNMPQKGDSKEILNAKEKARIEIEPKIYEELFQKEDNLIVKMMKNAEIIKTIKVDNVEKIDTQKFINIDEVVGTKSKIENLLKESIHSKESVDKFFKHVLILKRASIIKNIGFSIGALGLIVPGIMVALRFSGKDNKEFAVKKEIQKKLKNLNKAP